MTKERKIIVFVIITAFVAVALLVFRYEKLLIDKEREYKQPITVEGGVPVKKDYTATEIIELIKKCPEYLGDSVTIFEDGEMISSNGRFNGTLRAVISSEGNMQIVKNDMLMNRLPLQYNIYKLAAVYYRQQYPDDTIPPVRARPMDRKP